MSETVPTTALSLRSLVSAEGVVELSIVDEPVPAPEDHEVVVRVEAAPLNPSDLALLLAGADVARAKVGGTADRPVVTIPLPAEHLRALGARVGTPMAVGNEGAGTVVAAGASDDAQALLGRTVAAAAGAMYSQYRCVPAQGVLVLPEGTSAALAASSFVNPLTAIGIVETTRREGHAALVHTAAASNLGQMLVRLCLEEGLELVNIVRSPAQADRLRSLGAVYVCDSTSPDFMEELIAAISATSATIAFDAIGGGDLASKILTAMEVAASASSTEYSRYGSSTHKQLYIYGGLDRSPTVLTRSFGFAWGIGGWLLTPFLMSLSPEDFDRLRDRVVRGLSTTFASTYTGEVSLRGALDPAAFHVYARQATGEKFLITPQA